jgi:hypothetical protein
VVGLEQAQAHGLCYEPVAIGDRGSLAVAGQRGIGPAILQERESEIAEQLAHHVLLGDVPRAPQRRSQQPIAPVAIAHVGAGGRHRGFGVDDAADIAEPLEAAEQHFEPREAGFVRSIQVVVDGVQGMGQLVEFDPAHAEARAVVDLPLAGPVAGHPRDGVGELLRERSEGGVIVRVRLGRRVPQRPVRRLVCLDQSHDARAPPERDERVLVVFDHVAGERRAQLGDAAAQLRDGAGRAVAHREQAQARGDDGDEACDRAHAWRGPGHGEGRRTREILPVRDGRGSAEVRSPARRPRRASVLARVWGTGRRGPSERR